MTQIGTKAAVVLTCVLLGLAVPAAASTVDVASVGFSFVPPDVVITEGDSVHWTGLGGGFHTVAEVDSAIAGVWNGGFHSPGAASEFTFTFNVPGLYHYICEPHVGSGMRGTVTVNAVFVPTIPAVSPLGMALLVLLVLAAGAIVLRRLKMPT